MSTPGKNLRVGVIGVGHLGSLHAKMLSEIPSAELTGIFDVDTDRMNPLAVEIQVTAYPSVDHLMREVEAVSIVTPTSTHFEIARKAIENGLHVFIEKPITRLTSEAETLVRLAKKKN